MANKPMFGVPKGNVRVENPDGVQRTYGDGQRANYVDATYIPQSGEGFCAEAWGAFPRPGDDELPPIGSAQPTMRKPVNE